MNKLRAFWYLNCFVFLLFVSSTLHSSRMSWHNFSCQIAVHGKSFNHSARDAWELFQSTGVEALIAYDCSGAVLLMGTILGGLITGTCSGVWTWFRNSDKLIMVGSTAMLMGMILVSSPRWTTFYSAVPFLVACHARQREGSSYIIYL